jgi:hypothetical protein
MNMYERWCRRDIEKWKRSVKYIYMRCRKKFFIEANPNFLPFI